MLKYKSVCSIHPEVHDSGLKWEYISDNKLGNADFTETESKIWQLSGKRMTLPMKKILEAGQKTNGVRYEYSFSFLLLWSKPAKNNLGRNSLFWYTVWGYIQLYPWRLGGRSRGKLSISHLQPRNIMRNTRAPLAWSFIFSSEAKTMESHHPHLEHFHLNLTRLKTRTVTPRSFSFECFYILPTWQPILFIIGSNYIYFCVRMLGFWILFNWECCREYWLKEIKQGLVDNLMFYSWSRNRGFSLL